MSKFCICFLMCFVTKLVKNPLVNVGLLNIIIIFAESNIKLVRQVRRARLMLIF